MTNPAHLPLLRGPDRVAPNEDALDYAGDVKSRVRDAASAVHRAPTEAQLKAGNFRKGQVWAQGLHIAIENPLGTVRSGISSTGKRWSQRMKCHYGNLRRTEGADSENVDVYLGPHPQSEIVFIVDQVKPESARWDEHKVMMGFTDLPSARRAYLAHYPAGWKGLGAITPLTMSAFKQWLARGDLKRRFAGQAANFYAKEEGPSPPPAAPKPVAPPTPPVATGPLAAPSVSDNNKAMTPFTAKTYRGTGRVDAGAVYNPLVKAVGGVLGNDVEYHAMTPEQAKRYGPIVSSHEVSLTKPLIVRSDRDWRAIAAAAGVSPTLKKETLYNDPSGAAVKAAQAAVLKHLRDNGHDGIVIQMDSGQPTKGLYELFGHDQIVKIPGDQHYDRAAPATYADPLTTGPPRKGPIDPQHAGAYAPKGEGVLHPSLLKTPGQMPSGAQPEGLMKRPQLGPLGKDIPGMQQQQQPPAPPAPVPAGQLQAHLDTSPPPASIAHALLHGYPWNEATTGDHASMHRHLAGLEPHDLLEVAHHVGSAIHAGQAPHAERARLAVLDALIHSPPAPSHPLTPETRPYAAVADLSHLSPDQQAYGHAVLSSLPKIDGVPNGVFVPKGLDLQALVGQELPLKLTPLAVQERHQQLQQEAAQQAGQAVADEAQSPAQQKAVATRQSIYATLSSNTNTLPGLRKLNAAASAGDLQAGRLLSDIAADSLRYLTGGLQSVKVRSTPTLGLYGGDLEASLGSEVEFDSSDRPHVLAALAKFAGNFDQEQVHVRAGAEPGTQEGHDYGDGSYNTLAYRIKLKKPMQRAEVEHVIQQSGLFGMNASDEHLEAYYVGDPADAEAIRQFRQSARSATDAVGENAAGVTAGAQRLWVYGRGTGAIPYRDIEGDVRAAQPESNAAARRIAARLAGRQVAGAAPARTMTPQQEQLHKDIAVAYDAMRDNALSDPLVKRAYDDLAAEVKEQYEALPVKVEVRKGSGEPYKSSADMRKDVLGNNHIFIYGTDPNAFGPPGATYEGHPLLEDSGLQDVNGHPLLANDLLRAVHDYYAHTMTPAQFGALGEEAAWRNHMAMTRSPLARWALTSETRGQNSWVNYGPHGEANRADPKNTVFADQKVDLLPVEYALTGDQEQDRELMQVAKREQYRQQREALYYAAAPGAGGAPKPPQPPKAATPKPATPTAGEHPMLAHVQAMPATAVPPKVGSPSGQVAAFGQHLQRTPGFAEWMHDRHAAGDLPRDYDHVQQLLKLGLDARDFPQIAKIVRPGVPIEQALREHAGYQPEIQVVGADNQPPGVNTGHNRYYYVAGMRATKKNDGGDNWNWMWHGDHQRHLPKAEMRARGHHDLPNHSDYSHFRDLTPAERIAAGIDELPEFDTRPNEMLPEDWYARGGEHYAAPPGGAAPKPAPPPRPPKPVAPVLPKATASQPAAPTTQLRQPAPTRLRTTQVAPPQPGEQPAPTRNLGGKQPGPPPAPPSQAEDLPLAKDKPLDAEILDDDSKDARLHSALAALPNQYLSDQHVARHLLTQGATGPDRGAETITAATGQHLGDVLYSLQRMHRHGLVGYDSEQGYHLTPQFHEAMNPPPQSSPAGAASTPNSWTVSVELMDGRTLHLPVRADSKEGAVDAAMSQAAAQGQRIGNVLGAKPAGAPTGGAAPGQRPAAPPPPDEPWQGAHKEFHERWEADARQQNVRIDWDSGHQDTARALFGREAQPHEVAALANASGGMQVSASAWRNRLLNLQASGDGVDSDRTISRADNGDLFCENTSFGIGKNSPHKGAGYQFLARQVAMLRRLGVKRIETSAAGNKNSGIYNGYSTWPKLGFSGHIHEGIFGRLPGHLTQAMGRSREIRDLFDLPGGPEAWEQHGGSISCTFDLADGSRNMKALEAYIQHRESPEYAAQRAAKDAARQAAKQYERENMNEQPRRGPTPEQRAEVRRLQEEHYRNPTPASDERMLRAMEACGYPAEEGDGEA